MRNGIVYPLPPLAHLTGETASGLWPTPHGFSKDGKSNGPSGNELGRAVNRSLWPTPSANKTTLSGDLVNSDGTPWDGIGKPHSATTGKPVSTHLTDAVKMWPTPNARDHKDSGPNTNYAALAAKSKLAGTVGGSLNPQFVSWLMGYPLDWCDMPDESLPKSPTESKS